MARTFDTGHASPQRKLIVDKILEKLTPLLAPGLGGASDGFLEALISIGYRVDRSDEDYTIDLLWEDLRQRSPAVAVAALDLRSTQAGGPGRALGELEIELYVCSSHRRDVTEGRMSADAIATADDTADPGVWSILELVWSRLFDIKLEVATAHELKLEREAEIITAPEGTIWKQQWSIVVGRDANLYRGLTQMFTNAKTTLNPTDDQPDALNMKLDSNVVSWPIDPLGGKGVPSTSAHWTAVLKAAKWAGAAAANAWPMQELNGNLADAIGGQALAIAGVVTHNNPVPGWFRRAVGVAEGGLNAFFSNAIHQTNTSCLLLAYVRLTAAPGATRVVMGIGGGADHRYADVTAAPVYRAVENGGGATAGVANPGVVVRPVIVQINRAESRFSVITDQEIITEPWTDPSGAGGALLAFGAGLVGTAAPAQFLLGARLAGASAEKTTAQIKVLFETLGWPVAW